MAEVFAAGVVTLTLPTTPANRSLAGVVAGVVCTKVNALLLLSWTSPALLTLAVIPGAVLVPSEAIQTGQEGPFVYVIGHDMKVEARPVLAGAVIAAETIIERGLQAGETVVTDGQLRLMPGAVVRIKSGLDSGSPAATP